MKPVVLFFCVTFIVFKSFAQHCPWDCSGMIVVETPVATGIVYKLKPVLVDQDKKVIVDTIYGTDKPTYDRCDLLSYDDFTKVRTNKIALYEGYGYDTFYHFAAGRYIVKYNFCQYRDAPLYLRYSDLHSGAYHYIEIPQAIRIHLHDYNTQLRERKTLEMKNDLKTSVLPVKCEDWSLKKPDCQ